MKNSSTFEAKTAANFTRSMSGWRGFLASASTRWLKAIELSSRLMNTSGPIVPGAVGASRTDRFDLLIVISPVEVAVTTPQDASERLRV